MMKVITIFGTRPEAIKLAPVMKELEKYPDKFKSVICVTAQHREMLDQILKLFEIKPDYDLNIMENDQSLFDVTTKGLKGIKEILEKERPNIVLVQGDTTTTFVASLAAFYLKIPVGHVEAGLRTGNKYHPFPEEINRRLTSHIVDLHFAPTETAKQNLLSEGIEEDKIFVTGNTVIDILKIAVGQQSPVESQKKLKEYFWENWQLSTDNCKLILVTVHRRENFGQSLKNICSALRKIAINNPDVQIVYPVHLNPNVQEPVKRILNKVKNIHLIEPLDYGHFIYLMNKSYLILTDSGGIQEEAPSLSIPVLVMRETTERSEAVEAGTAKLVGSDKDKIIKETQLILDNKQEYGKMAKDINTYGDGKTAERIVRILSSKLL